MDAHAGTFEQSAYPVRVEIRPALEGRDRLTTFFRFFLALPHFILVGGPVAVLTWVGWQSHTGVRLGSGSGGLLSILMCAVVVAAWFAILVTGRYPQSLLSLSTCYLRWRVRASAYMTLLTDAYPPFGEGKGEYPVVLELPGDVGERDRVSVAIRLLLALPQMLVLWFLSMAWALTTALSWAVILITGRHPETLYGFAMGALAWSTRVEAYLLLLTDEYPPFSLRA